MLPNEKLAWNVTTRRALQGAGIGAAGGLARGLMTDNGQADMGHYARNVVGGGLIGGVAGAGIGRMERPDILARAQARRATQTAADNALVHHALTTPEGIQQFTANNRYFGHIGMGNTPMPSAHAPAAPTQTAAAPARHPTMAASGRPATQAETQTAQKAQTMAAPGPQRQNTIQVQGQPVSAPLPRVQGHPVPSQDPNATIAVRGQATGAPAPVVQGQPVQQRAPTMQGPEMTGTAPTLVQRDRATMASPERPDSPTTVMRDRATLASPVQPSAPARTPTAGGPAYAPVSHPTTVADAPITQPPQATNAVGPGGARVQQPRQFDSQVTPPEGRRFPLSTQEQARIQALDPAELNAVHQDLGRHFYSGHQSNPEVESLAGQRYSHPGAQAVFTNPRLNPDIGAILQDPRFQGLDSRQMGALASMSTVGRSRGIPLTPDTAAAYMQHPHFNEMMKTNSLRDGAKYAASLFA